MKKIYKILSILTILLLLVAFAGCNTTNNKPIEKLTIVTVNDFHGALEEDGSKFGAARLAAGIKNVVKNSEAAVVVSSGDMFQGTALSNYDHGKTVIDVMNEIGFDSMTLGNHEFDWGLGETLKYVDGNKDNGEAIFPMLGCNIIEKETGERPEGVNASHLIEKGDLKIGIVGWMDATAEADIANIMIDPYEFAPAMPYIKEAIKDLRVNQDADIVIVVGHQGNELNNELASLEGDEKVDAIVNGHSHASYYGTIKGNNGIEIPYIQAGSAGEKYGVMELTLNPNTKEVTGATSVYKQNVASAKDSKVQSIVNDLKELTAPVFGKVIGTATQTVERGAGTDWAATALWQYCQTDLAVINAGGIRAQAFPIYAGDSLLVSTVHTIMPFDNTVKTVDLKGEDVRTLIYLFVSSANVVREGDYIYINGELLDDSKTYSVASIDYIFDKPENPFLKGDNIVATGVLFRDVLIQRVELDKTIIIPERTKE